MINLSSLILTTGKKLPIPIAAMILRQTQYRHPIIVQEHRSDAGTVQMDHIIGLSGEIIQQ